MNKYLKISFVLVLILTQTVTAQNVDSLKNVLLQTQINTDRLEVSRQLTNFYKYTNQDSAIYYAEVMGKAAKAINDTTAWVESLNQRGALSIMKRDFQQASDLLTQGITLLGSKNRELLGKLYINQGNVALYQQSFDNALQYYQKSLEYVDKEGRPEDYVKANNNMAIIYAQLKALEKAKVHFEEAIKIHQKEDLLSLQILINLGSVYEDSGKRKEARKYYDMAEKLAPKIGSMAMESMLYSNMSKFYLTSEEWVKSLEYGMKGLSLQERQGKKPSPIALNNIGYAHLRMGNKREAIHYLELALPDAVGLTKEQVLLNLKNAYLEAKNMNKAIQYFEAYNDVKDSLSNLEYKSKVAELTEKYESEIKQEEINRLNVENDLQKVRLQQQQFLFGLAITMFFLMAGLGYLWFNQYKTKQLLSKTLLQQRLFRAQLNPHFIFHALGSIQNFLYKHDTEKSMLYLNSFSRLIRLILEGSDRELVPVSEEVEMLENYLQLQQLTAKNRFEYKVEAPDEIVEGDLKMPSMLTQPIVENALVHGLSHRDGGMVNVNFVIDHGVLKVKVEDNGSGIKGDINKGNNRLHRSMGKKIVRQRIANFNRVNKQKISMEVSALSDDEAYPGTVVWLNIPSLY